MTAERAPILIFDGRCGFCTRAVEWAVARLTRPVRAVPYQAVDLSRFGLTEEQAKEHAWWVTPDGRARRGHLAVAHTLRACRMPWPVLGWLLLIPPVRWAGALGYRLVSKGRGHLPGSTPACDRAWDMTSGRPA